MLNMGNFILGLYIVYWLAGDALTRQKVGELSASALFSVLLLSASFLLVGIAILRKRLVRSCVQEGRGLAFCWLVLGVLGFIQLWILNLSIPAFQQVLGWGLYGLTILLFYFYPPQLRQRSLSLLLRSAIILGALFLISFPSRSFAAGFVLMSSVAFYLEKRLVIRLTLLIVAVLALGLSGSRMATVALLIAVVAPFLARTRLKAPSSWGYPIIAIALVGVGAFFLISTPAFMRTVSLLELITQGGSPEELRVLTSGRSAVWGEIYLHALESPIWGHGPGAASELAFAISRNERFAHPHNDYLRIFHDYGVLGFILFAAFYGLLLKKARKWLLRPKASEILPWAEAMFASTIALLMLYLTDNLVIYAFVTSFHGAIMGIFLRKLCAHGFGGYRGTF